MTTAALLDGRPRRAPGLVIGPAVLRGTRTVHLIKDRVSGRFFEIGPKERFIIERLDGARSLAEIGEEYARAFGRVIDEQAWGAILATLWRRAFLEAPDGRRPGPPEPPVRSPPGPGA